jgi:hypothetical protein
LTLMGIAGAYNAGGAIMGAALALCLAVFAMALLNALRHPERGFIDQLCRTAVVPR